MSKTNGSWKELECEVDNTIGRHDVFFVFKGPANTELFDFNYWFFTSNATLVPQTPYLAQKHAVPGQIELEDYDEGGQNRAYYDSDTDNQGGEYRNDRVDIVTNDDGYAVGYTAEGEWLEYTVDIQKTQAFQFEAKVSCGLNTSGFQLFLDDNEITDIVEVPNTLDWDTYAIVKGKTGTLNEGEHVLKVLLTGVYANLDWLRFTDGTETLITPLAAQKNPRYEKAIVYDMGGKLVGYANLHSSDDADWASQLSNQQFPANTYLVKTNGRSRVVVCK